MASIGSTAACTVWGGQCLPQGGGMAIPGCRLGMGVQLPEGREEYRHGARRTMTPGDHGVRPATPTTPASIGRPRHSGNPARPAIIPTQGGRHASRTAEREHDQSATVPRVPGLAACWCQVSINGLPPQELGTLNLANTPPLCYHNSVAMRTRGLCGRAALTANRPEFWAQFHWDGPAQRTTTGKGFSRESREAIFSLQERCRHGYPRRDGH